MSNATSLQDLTSFLIILLVIEVERTYQQRKTTQATEVSVFFLSIHFKHFTIKIRSIKRFKKHNQRKKREK